MFEMRDSDVKYAAELKETFVKAMSNIMTKVFLSIPKDSAADPQVLFKSILLTMKEQRAIILIMQHVLIDWQVERAERLISCVFVILLISASRNVPIQDVALWFITGLTQLG